MRRLTGSNNQTQQHPFIYHADDGKVKTLLRARPFCV
jgi:hypothetical protein